MAARSIPSNLSLSSITKIVSVLILFSLVLIFLPSPAPAQNPFGKPGKKEALDRPAQERSVFDKMAEWQRLMNQKITRAARQYKRDGNPTVLILLSGLAFLYGGLHAAGPGHGKLVAASFILAKGTNLRRSILFGGLIGFLHGLTAVVLIVVVYFLIKSSVSQSLSQVERLTKITSYSLISIIGAGLSAKLILDMIGRGKEKSGGIGRLKTSPGLDHLPAAIVVGFIPCPVVVLIMVFCLSLGLPWLGLTLSFFQTLGMIVTISIIAGLSSLGGGLVMKGFKEDRPFFGTLVQSFRLIGSLGVLSVGLILLFAVI